MARGARRDVITLVGVKKLQLPQGVTGGASFGFCRKPNRSQPGDMGAKRSTMVTNLHNEKLRLGGNE